MTTPFDPLEPFAPLHAPDVGVWDGDFFGALAVAPPATSPASAGVDERDPYGGKLPSDIYTGMSGFVAGAQPGSCGFFCDYSTYRTGVHGINSSALKYVLRSPFHYRAYLDGKVPDVDSAARQFGRAVHTYLFERAEYGSRYRIWSNGDRRSGAYREFAEAAHSKGQEVLTAAESARVVCCAEAMRSADPLFNFDAWLSGGHSETGVTHEPARCEFVLVWLDETTQLWQKARLDAVGVGAVRLIIEGKTTGDATMNGFRSEVFRQNYDLQAAHYLAGASAVFGGRFEFAWLAGEGAPPHGAQLLQAGERTRENGAVKRREALRRVKSCLDTGRWPVHLDTSGSGDVVTVEPVYASEIWVGKGD